MKKIIALAAALGLALCLCACAGDAGTGTGTGAGNELLSAASPKSSALMLYASRDGQSARRLTMFDSGVEQAILDELAKVEAQPAPDWTPRDVTMPVYGLEIGRKDGEPGWLEAAWSNGYMIMADGSAYRFDFDFTVLETAFSWRESDEGLPIGSLPCSRVLAQDGETWISSMLTPAQELKAPEGISMSLDYLDFTGDEGVIALTFHNGNDVEWCYGTYYHLEVLLDGAWYVVPPAEGGLAFNDIAMILPAGESRQEFYHTGAYGELPPGRYRIVAEDMAAEFTLEASPD